MIKSPYPAQLTDCFRLEGLGPDTDLEALALELNRVYVENPHFGTYDPYFKQRVNNLDLITQGLLKVQERTAQGLSLTCYGRYNGELVTSVMFGISPYGSEAMIGRWVAKPYEGRKLVSTASRHILSVAFTNGVDRVWSEVHPDNERIQTLNTRLGFVAAEQLGLSTPDGLPEPDPAHQLYVLTAPSWIEQQKAEQIKL